ncbi:NADH--cytochrome b5 reductase 1-like isoform X2 [Rutidosis leptorrhynchoides]|uniref:NADH--cytochrome b5 reductase 1-like isoform X2 n=1 Tax=Rutidosis leptorrhynchoides TaxID=125765 RepID=UPI003A9A5B6B
MLKACSDTMMYQSLLYQHLYFEKQRGEDSQGEEVIKSYTPTTLDTDVGYFELVIKMYLQGRMSHHFKEMLEGDYMAVKGPKGRFKNQPGQVKAFGMLAGGSEITPMFYLCLENGSCWVGTQTGQIHWRKEVL